jgi:hypothetical protein
MMMGLIIGMTIGLIVIMIMIMMIAMKYGFQDDRKQIFQTRNGPMNHVEDASLRRQWQSEKAHGMSKSKVPVAGDFQIPNQEGWIDLEQEVSHPPSLVVRLLEERGHVHRTVRVDDQACDADVQYDSHFAVPTMNVVPLSRHVFWKTKNGPERALMGHCTVRKNLFHSLNKRRFRKATTELLRFSGSSDGCFGSVERGGTRRNRKCQCQWSCSFYFCLITIPSMR